MTLEQLKLDYINFVTQSYSTVGFDPNKTGVLFTLLMEQDSLTQEQIMKITGFSRSKVSIALNELMGLQSQYPVLQTKMPSDSKKYYKCPLSFEQYIQKFFTASFEISNFNFDFLQILVDKLVAFDPSNASIVHVKHYFEYLLLSQEYYKTFIEHSKNELADYFNSNDLKSEVFIDRYRNRLKDSVSRTRTKTKYSDAKFMEIKKEFLTTMQDLTSSYAGRKDLISVFLSLYLEYLPTTQDHIIELTGYSRSTVSEVLSILVKLNRVQIIKRAKDRKKYYKPFIKIENYGFLKFQTIKHFFSQLIDILKIKFLSELEELSLEKHEKKKYKNFFESNIYHFSQLLKYTTLMYEIIFQQFSKEIKID